MCSISDDAIVIACHSKGLRAVSLHTASLSPDVCTLTNVVRVAFDVKTDTILLIVSEEKSAFWLGPQITIYWLLSLRRDASQWVEVQRLRCEPTEFCVGDLVACNTRVLLAERDFHNRLYAFAVSAEHSIRSVGTVRVDNDFEQFAATRLDADTLVAFAHYSVLNKVRNSVSLQLLDAELRLEPLARFALSGSPYHLLFCGELLLVEDFNKDTRTSEIVSLNTSGGQLTSREVILKSNANVNVKMWCLAGNQLVICDGSSKGDLLVYAFE